LRELYRKIGQATDLAAVSVSGKSANITGILASVNAAPNLVKNSTNDGTADSIDAGADATVRVYGPGGVGSSWTRYRNAASVATHAAVTFTGKAYSTRFYLGYDVLLNNWTISTALKDVTGDSMITFSVKTVASGGAGGIAGGGGTGAGGSGGADASDRAGYGLLL
jgi:D-arabinose 1-dehydrogenase-like Zn-dependent alcohol dehydrogenase